MPDYWTSCFDNLRTGWNPEEVILTPDLLKKSFSLLFTYQVTGRVLAQPLAVAGVTAYPGGDTSKPPQTLDLVFVATEDNFIHAFNAKESTEIWHRQLLPANERLITPSDLPDPNNPSSLCNNIKPHYGITGTPVIDVAAKIMYVVAPSAMDSSGGTSFFQRLYAIDLGTGSDRLTPVAIGAFVSFPGDPNNYTFDSHWQLQRGGLLLLNGVVYVPFGSHCDFQDYHGWIMAFDASTLAFIGAFVSSTNGGQAGIWQAGRGLAGGNDGYVYCMTGNGNRPLDPAHPHNWGDCVLKLSPRPNPADSLTQNYIGVEDAFCPCNYHWLNLYDVDLGSGGPLLLPDQTAPGNQVRHLLVAAGKEGTVYLLDRDSLGGINLSSSPPPQDRPCAEPGALTVLWRVLGQASTATENRDAVFGGPAYCAPTSPAGLLPRIYYCAQNDTVKAFSYDPSSNALVGPVWQSKEVIPEGSIPVVSSNGGFADTVIVWIVSRSNPITLSAYYMALGINVINITVGGWGGSFAPPATVVNSRVYVPFDVLATDGTVTSSAVSVFGSALSSAKCFIATAVEGGESFKVSTLRVFRDKYLTTNLMGTRFIALYERVSPFFAKVLEKSRPLRMIARGLIVWPAFLLAKTLLRGTRRNNNR